MRKVILTLVLILLLANISLAANLGVYKTGDTVTYSVVCLTDEGAKDTGCGTFDDDILDPDDTTAKAPTSALAEVSDANFPGLWRGSYLIPASPLKGTWSIFIELTNSNSTTAGTVLNFQVLTDYFATQGNLTSGIVVLTSATETQINNIETDTAAQDTSTELRTLLTGSDTAVSTLTTSDNIGVNFDDISGTLHAAEIATDAITAAKIAADAIGASEAGFLSDSTAFAGADIGSILTDTNEIQGNQSSFITATGFSTHSAADVWTAGSRALSTPADYKADVSTLATTSQLNANVSTILSDTNAILVDTNEIQGNQSNFITATGFSTSSQLNTNVSTILSDTNAILVDSNELQIDWTNGGRLDLLLDRILTATEVKQGSVASAGATTSIFTSNLTETTNDFWNRNSLLFTSGNCAGQTRKIHDYDGTSKNITFYTALSFAPANGDTFIIITPRNFRTNLADLLLTADYVWDELQSGHTTNGTFGYYLDDSISGVSTSGLSSAQNATLYNTYEVVGTKDEYDQSIADMLAYNVSDGNVETDLDSTGGTSPAAVWGYNITGGSSESAAWYITTIKTIVEWIERFF